MQNSLPEPPLPGPSQVADAGALGRAVRAQRRAAGLRIDDAAALCGVSVTVLSRLENATSAITTQNLFRVLDGLGLTLVVLDKIETPRLLATLSRQAPK